MNPKLIITLVSLTLPHYLIALETWTVASIGKKTDFVGRKII